MRMTIPEGIAGTLAAEISHEVDVRRPLAVAGIPRLPDGSAAIRDGVLGLRE